MVCLEIWDDIPYCIIVGFLPFVAGEIVESKLRYHNFSKSIYIPALVATTVSTGAIAIPLAFAVGTVEVIYSITKSCFFR